MSNPQIPPQVQEQFMKMQQAQQNLQSLMAQKQQLEIDRIETDKALDELKKAGDGDIVYKQAGTVLIQSTKDVLISELEEHKELTNTRSTVLQKQETRIQESLREYETKLNEMMKNVAGNTGQQSSSSQQQPPPPRN